MVWGRAEERTGVLIVCSLDAQAVNRMLMPTNRMMLFIASRGPSKINTQNGAGGFTQSGAEESSRRTLYGLNQKRHRADISLHAPTSFDEAQAL